MNIPWLIDRLVPFVLIIVGMVVHYVVLRALLRLLVSRLSAHWLTLGLTASLSLAGLGFSEFSRHGFLHDILSGAATLKQQSGVVLLLLLVALNALVLPVIYGIDKRRAQIAARERIPESVLHTLAFMGGGIGAMLGQALFRHKTSKQPFRRIFWCSLLTSLMLYVALLRYYLFL